MANHFPISCGVGRTTKTDRAVLEREWIKFMSGEASQANVRSSMVESWKRCLQQGVDPFQGRASVFLEMSEVRERRSADPLFRMIKPFLRKLRESAAQTGYLVIYCNTDGQLLYIDGELPLMLKADDIYLQHGSDWSESSAGTNAIGTALVTGMPVEVFAGEHFCHNIHTWTCAAAPIRDPATGETLGVIDLSGLWSVNHPQAIAAVAATAREIEAMLHNQLRIERFRLSQHYNQLTKKTPVPVAVIDRGGRVIRASRALYENGWIASRQRVHYADRRRDDWKCETTPYYYGGMPIGSVVYVLPQDIALHPYAQLFHSPTANQAPPATEPPVPIGPEAKQEPLYKALFEQFPDPILVFDPSGIVMEINPAAERLLGWKAEELRQTNIADITVPKYRKRTLEAITAAAAGKQQEYETLFRHKQGHVVHTALRSFPVIVGNEIVGVYETIKVIIPNDQLQDDLRTAKEQLELFMRNTDDAIVVVDADGFVIKANRAFERIYGWSEAELIGRTLPTVPEHLMDEMYELHDKMLTSRHMINYETVRLHKDGSRIDVSNFTSPIFDSNGNVIVYVMISKDITQNIRMGEELKESEKRLRTLINAMPDMVIFKDNQGRWIEANDVALSSFHLQDVSYRGMTDDDLADSTPSFREAFMAQLIAGLSHSESLARDQEIIPDRGRPPAVYDVVQVPIYHADGSRKGVVIIGRNITELKQTEELLRKSEKLAVVGQLAAGIAHEIRNPLTTLKGFIQMLKSQTSDKNNWYLDVMLAEINQLEWITSQFMTMAKPQSSKFALHSLAHVAGQVASLLYPLATMHNVQISMDEEPYLPLVECDENQLKQVFINIVKNAIESMPEGGNVEIGIHRHSFDSVSVRVTDHGCGIPRERIPLLGEPFYSLKEKGTGLGLMICYKIVKEHRGKIDIGSEVGRGTTIEIILPVSSRI